MINIVLVEPEIPMNTGNVARTCAATGSTLHLIEPLGFDISDKAVKRAGLDYWHLVDVHVYASLDDFFARNPQPDLWLTTTRSARRYSERCVRLPMREEARSLNLANTVAAVTYEALRQLDFPGLIQDGHRAWEEQKACAIRR